MKRSCAVILLLTLWTIWAKGEDKLLDIGIVLDVSGDWSLESGANSTPVPLHKGHALPAGGKISSHSATGKIIIHIYDKTQPDTYSTPPGPSTFVLPTTLERFPGYPERFWKIFQRLFGGHPDDFTVTISQASSSEGFIGSADPPFGFTNYNNTFINFNYGLLNYSSILPKYGLLNHYDSLIGSTIIPCPDTVHMTTIMRILITV
jgi:hypothetical protein